MSEIVVKMPKPHPGQIAMLKEARRFNVAECGRRFGKTRLGECTLAADAIEGWPVAWFAPTYKYYADVWNDLTTLLRPVMLAQNKQEGRMQLRGGGVVDVWSMHDNPDAGRGKKYKKVVVDEASIVRNFQQTWEGAIRPTLTDLKGGAWFLFTPKGHNYVHRSLWGRGQGQDIEWKSWRMPTSANPYIDPTEIEAASKDMPEHIFLQEYEAIPADDGGNPFGIKSIEACVIQGLGDGPAVVYGVDLAKSVDWTVAVGLNDEGDVCDLHRWQSDWGQTRRRLLDIIGDTPTLMDSTGVGDPIVEDIQRERPNVQGFKFTSTSKQQLMEGLASVIQRGEAGIPDGWLRHELEAFEYQFTAGGVKYSAPDGLHDDGVCGLALAVRHKGQAVEPWAVRIGGDDVGGKDDTFSEDADIWRTGVGGRWD